jgi:hypothetical protein
MTCENCTNHTATIMVAGEFLYLCISIMNITEENICVVKIT